MALRITRGAPVRCRRAEAWEAWLAVSGIAPDGGFDQRTLAVAGGLTITADGGGSNGSRVRLWKIELQRLAD